MIVDKLRNHGLDCRNVLQKIVSWKKLLRWNQQVAVKVTWICFRAGKDLGFKKSFEVFIGVLVS